MIATRLTNLTALAACLTFVAAAQAPSQKTTAAPQRGYDTPLAAADALIAASETYDTAALREIFGPGGEDLVATHDPVQDKNYAAAFTALAREKKEVTVDPKNKSRAILTVGSADWPLPVPLVKKSGKWYFDTNVGRQEILFRRIGANELDAIQVCRGFVEAQKEYASELHDGSTTHQYAQRILSTPGKHDGLYWTNNDGTPGGPVSAAVAKAIEEGYSPSVISAYHGYYFKVLKGQGPAAPLGELDYVIEGMMIGGFGLIAVPAEYRVSGVKTFIVNHQGIVYQKDLGRETLNLAKKIERYNPDSTWQRTEDEWP